MNNPSKIEVPDHILDMVVERANAYAENKKDRWLGGFTDDAAQDIEHASTHNIIDTPQRRELHREILQEIAQNTSEDIPEQSTFIYFAGPMASGKSSIRQVFDERIEGSDAGAYQDPNIENAFQTYKNAQGHLMYSDFAFYKETLPEFEQNGQEFAVIRPEASALDQAVTAWARELKANIILEQLGDGVKDEWAKDKAEQHNFIVIGVTTDPAINGQRLHDRNARTGESISDEELTGTIKGFSGGHAFKKVAQHAAQAVLISTDTDDFSVIYAAENGNEVSKNSKEFAKFESYADLSEEALLTAVRGNDAPHIDADNAPPFEL